MILNRNDSNYNYIFVDKYKFYLINNVKKFFHDHGKYNLWNIELYDTNKCNNPQYYLIIDTSYRKGFGHWVYESAIYVPVYNRLKIKFPNIKMVLSDSYDFNFAKNILNFLGIKKEDIFSIHKPFKNLREIPDVIYFENNNICLFHEPNAYLCDLTITDEYKLYVDMFYNKLNIYSNIEKTIDILYLDRSSGINNVNNRIYDTKKFIELLFKNYSNYVIKIIDPNDFKDFNEQIYTINMSKNIILPSGSSFLVNSLYINNSNIYILDSMNIEELTLFPHVEYIFNITMSKNNNKIYCVENIMKIADDSTLNRSNIFDENKLINTFKMMFENKINYSFDNYTYLNSIHSNNELINGDFMCNNIRFYKYKNVRRYIKLLRMPEKIGITLYSDYNIKHYINKQEENYYIIDINPYIDNNEWIYKHGVYIYLYHDLIKIFKNLKIVIINSNSTKLALLKHFNVKLEDVLFLDFSKYNKYEDIVFNEHTFFTNQNNTCIFYPNSITYEHNRYFNEVKKILNI